MQLLFHALHLLDGKILGALGLQCSGLCHYIVDLLLQVHFLPFIGKRYLFKLTVPDHDNVKVAGSNAGAELFAVCLFKIRFARYQNFRVGVEQQRLGRHLLGQMVGHYDQRFIAKTQALFLHGAGDHLERLASAHLVCQQYVVAVQHVGNGVALVWPQRNFRIHAGKAQIAAVILPRADAVEFAVVQAYQCLPTLRLLENPFFKLVFYQALLCVGGLGGGVVQHAFFVSLCVGNCIKHLADAFDPNKDNWHSEYTQLKELLTPEEYAAAQESTLTAFYTPPAVIHAMYRTLTRMGCVGGNVLEPSMGVGAFFGHRSGSFDTNNAKLYGIELDSLSGRFAQQLYQKAKIQICGYEKVDLPDSFFDLAIGNVPFGQYQVTDRQYDKLHFQIHDYFLAKTVDKLRVGGIMAFITTSGTMDKKSENVRRYLAARCDLIGAVRLPNNTFTAQAGTTVTSDILFLQKRGRVLEQDVPWIHVGETADGIPLNRYFIDHPEMICGEMQMVSGPYGQRPTCAPLENGTSLEGQLDTALANLQAEYTLADDREDAQEESDMLDADPGTRNFSYVVKDDTVYYRENSKMRAVKASTSALARIKALVPLRDTCRELIRAQLDNLPDETIAALQAQLTAQYDSYHDTYGLINSRGTASAFREDSGYFLLCSLEDIDSEGHYRGKTDMFTKRTIRPAQVVDHVDTADEALVLSLTEKARVDLAYMAQVTGKLQDEIIRDLTSVIFRDPEQDEPVYLPADEYLSGNVRQKLAVARLAATSDPDYQVNVKALEQVQPKDLDASEIAVRLGATWIPPEYIQDFLMELLEPPLSTRLSVKVLFASFTGEWNITNKRYGNGSIKATVTYGTNRKNAYEITEAALNLRPVQTAPPEIPGQNILLGFRGRCTALLDLLECPNCI